MRTAFPPLTSGRGAVLSTFTNQQGARRVGTSQAIPDSRGGRVWRRILTVVLIASIVGIADQLRTIFWFVLNGEGPNLVRTVMMLLGWMGLCWCGYRAYRHNLAPPFWIAVTLPLLVWAYLLWPE